MVVSHPLFNGQVNVHIYKKPVVTAPTAAPFSRPVTGPVQTPSTGPFVMLPKLAPKFVNKVLQGKNPINHAVLM